MLRVPHITASVAEGTKPINTANLNFIPLKKPIKIIGRFGFWIKEDGNEYLSFNPYAKNKSK